MHPNTSATLMLLHPGNGPSQIESSNEEPASDMDEVHTEEYLEVPFPKISANIVNMQRNHIQPPAPKKTSNFTEHIHMQTACRPVPVIQSCLQHQQFCQDHCQILTPHFPSYFHLELIGS